MDIRLRPAGRHSILSGIVNFTLSFALGHSILQSIIRLHGECRHRTTISHLCTYTHSQTSPVSIMRHRQIKTCSYKLKTFVGL